MRGGRRQERLAVRLSSEKRKMSVVPKAGPSVDPSASTRRPLPINLTSRPATTPQESPPSRSPVLSCPVVCIASKAGRKRNGIFSVPACGANLPLPVAIRRAHDPCRISCFNYGIGFQKRAGFPSANFLVKRLGVGLEMQSVGPQPRSMSTVAAAS
jgi:hypothetical protein